MEQNANATGNKTATITVRVDENTKRDFDTFCSNVGMNASVAVNMFICAVLRERRLPFIVTDDPFYSKANQERLTAAMDQLEAGGGTRHELIEDDDG